MVQAIPDSQDEFASWEDYTADLDLPPVLRHALDAFVMSGYHGTTVRDIAKRLGQTVPAIYYHYENKQALLVALLTKSIDELLWRCAQADEHSPDDPVQRLESIIRCIVLFVANRPQLAYLDAEIRSLEPGNREPYIVKRDRMQEMVTRVITAGMEKGVFLPGDSHSHARAIITMLRGVANWYRPSGPLNSQDLAAQYVTYSLRIVGYVGPGSS